MKKNFYKAIKKTEFIEITEEEATELITKIQADIVNKWIEKIYKAAAMYSGLDEINICCSIEAITVEGVVNINANRISLKKIICKDGRTIKFYKINNFDEEQGEINKETLQRYFFDNNIYPLDVQGFVHRLNNEV